MWLGGVRSLLSSVKHDIEKQDSGLGTVARAGCRAKAGRFRFVSTAIFAVHILDGDKTTEGRKATHTTIHKNTFNLVFFSWTNAAQGASK